MTFKTMIATSAVAIALATSAMADTNFTGAYIGGNFGYTAERIFNKSKTDMKGVMGGLHAGYQHQFGKFVLGAEGSFDLSNAKAKGSNNIAAAKIRHNKTFGVAARTGFAVTNWMPYAKFGWEVSQVSSKGSFNNGLIRATGSTTNYKHAFVVGAGVETLIADHIMVGGEWTTSFYENHTLSNDNTHLNKFKVRLGYKF